MEKLVGNCWMLVFSHVTLVLFSLTSGNQRQSRPLIYQLVEEQPVDTFIADIRRDSGIAAESTKSRLTFSLLVESAHFKVDRGTGVLRTSEVIDRDVLCPGQSVCRLSVDVVVRPVMYFRKVTVEIVDLNDNSPTFPHRNATVYVSEATFPGQLLYPVQSAYDVDSPRYGVKGYRLIDGSARISETFQLSVDNTSTGGFDVRLVLRQSLDRERRSFYQIQVSKVSN